MVVAAWVAATPFTSRHHRVVERVSSALIGAVQRLFEHVDAKPGQYPAKKISPYFWHNGKYPEGAEHLALQANDFRDYRLRITRLADNPVELTPDQLRARSTIATSRRSRTAIQNGEIAQGNRIRGAILGHWWRSWWVQQRRRILRLSSICLLAARINFFLPSSRARAGYSLETDASAGCWSQQKPKRMPLPLRRSAG